MCCALTSSSVNELSSTFQGAFQYTPVLSSATCVTPCAVNQSANASKSAVMVLKVRISLCGCLPAPGTTTQATTVSLCTSSPQQRSYTTSMDQTLLSDWWPSRGVPQITDFAVRASRRTRATVSGASGTPRSI